jgi:aldehyde dehydrogenase (NAD+)
LIEKNADELAALDVIDNGKPFSIARNYDLEDAIRNFRYQAGVADKIHGDTIPLMGPYFCYTRPEPCGVVGQIIPWNYPLQMSAWKLAPALAAGCTIVLKPAEQTPLSVLRLGELINEAGFPPGVVNIVPGFGETAGEALTLHPLVDKIAFTGSTEVGKRIMKNAGTANLKRVCLELGGKSPNIIMHDADLDVAVEQAQCAIYNNGGQNCVAGSRTYVHAQIYDKFLEKTAAAASKRKLGDPFAADTDLGPMIDKTQLDKILGYVEAGKQDGATLVVGGKKWGSKGYFVESTVFADVKDNMRSAREEIFGPVMSVIKYNDYEDIIERANRTEYGLGAGIVTRDIERAFKVANALKAGTVYVNCYDVCMHNTPFGGFKNSGVGRELGLDAVKTYLEMKTVIIKQADDALP